MKRPRLTAEDAIVAAAKLRECAADLRKEAAMFANCRANTINPANERYYADEYAQKTLLAGAFERVAQELRR